MSLRLLFMESKAATKIQAWWRAYLVKKHIVDEIKSEFEQMSKDVGDFSPTWHSEYYCNPVFPKTSDQTRIKDLMSKIAQREYELHIEEDLSQLKENS